MKKVLLIAVAFVTLTMNAQTEKGKWIFGGNTSLSFSTTNSKFEFDGQTADDDLKTNIFTVNPNVGYFVADNLAVGLDLTFTSTKFEQDSFEDKSNSFAVIPGATYFFGSDKFKPFIGAGVGLISTSAGDEDFNKSSGLAIRGEAGVAYFINDTVSIDFLVQYVNSNQKNKENSDFETKNSNFGVGLGFSIYL